MPEFKNFIKKKRQEYGWTQKEFAEYVGVNLRTVQGWEYGRKPLKIVEAMIRIILKMKDHIDRIERG